MSSCCSPPRNVTRHVHGVVWVKAQYAGSFCVARSGALCISAAAEQKTSSVFGVWHSLQIRARVAVGLALLKHTDTVPTRQRCFLRRRNPVRCFHSRNNSPHAYELCRPVKHAILAARINLLAVVICAGQHGTHSSLTELMSIFLPRKGTKPLLSTTPQSTGPETTLYCDST